MFNRKNSGFKELNDSVPDTLISANVKIKGQIQFSGGIQIDGSLEGDIEATEGSTARLWVTEKGKITGLVKVPSITINGEVEGDVYANEHLELAENAIIKGNVYYKVIEMAQGASVNGELHKVEEPAKASVTNLPSDTSLPSEQSTQVS
jgi:cytoskeletal protein CcmA (bactofilin family)